MWRTASPRRAAQSRRSSPAPLLKAQSFWPFRFGDAGRRAPAFQHFGVQVDDSAIWPAKPSETEKHIDFSEKLKRLAVFHGEGLHNAVAWRRWQTAMDAWCALWVWPIEKAALLPSRSSFIADLALVLEGRMGGRVPAAADFTSRAAQGALFETVMVPGRKDSGKLFSTEERAAVLERIELLGDVDVDKLIKVSSWLPTAIEVAAKRRFMHYDLEFADVMRERQGFRPACSVISAH
jgi:hypothetical protein